MGALTSLGKNSKTTFLVVENEKLSVEFTVAASNTIRNGMAVKLNTTGQVVPWVKTDALNLCIGIAYTPKQETAAEGTLVTVVMRGYIMIFAMLAANSTAAGLGTVNGYNTANEDPHGNLGYNVYEAAASNTANAWILDPGDQYDVVRVVVMN